MEWKRDKGAYRLSRHSIRTSLNLALRMCSNEKTYREEKESRASRSLAMVPAFCSRPLLVVLVRETVGSDGGERERGGGASEDTLRVFTAFKS